MINKSFVVANRNLSTGFENAVLQEKQDLTGTGRWTWPQSSCNMQEMMPKMLQIIVFLKTSGVSTWKPLRWLISPWARTPPACRSRSWSPASGPCRLWMAEWRERGKQRAKTKPSNNETHTRKEGGWRKERKRTTGREEENRVSAFSSQESERRETVRVVGRINASGLRFETFSKGRRRLDSPVHPQIF